MQKPSQLKLSTTFEMPAPQARKFLDLGHEGPIPIADTFLVSEEEEVKEVKDKRSNIICLPTFF